MIHGMHPLVKQQQQLGAMSEPNYEAITGGILGGLSGMAAGLWFARRDPLSGLLVGAAFGAVIGFVAGGTVKRVVSRSLR